MDFNDMELPPIKKMSRRRKYLIAGLLLGAAVLLVFLYLKDDALEDAPDLMAETLEIEEAENGLRFFDGITERDEEEDETFDKLDLMLRDDISWDAESAVRQTERFGELIAAFEKSAASPVFRLTRADGKLDERYSLLRDAMILVRAKVRLSLEEGRTEEALKYAELCFRQGESAVKNADSYIGMLVGHTLIGVGKHMLKTLVLDSGIPVDERIYQSCADASRVWQRLEASRPAVCAREYRNFRRMILSLENAEVYAGREHPEFLFKRNRTINRYAEQCRADREVADKTYREIQESVPDYTEVSPFRRAFSSNRTGNYILEMTGSGAVIFLRMIPNKAETEILQVCAALRLFHRDHGELPDSLAELVPEYMDVLPPDRYDGSDLKYDKLRARVWCVGKDLLDSSGPDEGEETLFSKMDDPGLQLDWLAGKKGSPAN